MTETQDRARTRERLEVHVRKVTRSELPELSAVLARAFNDDPLVNWMVAQDRRRARRVYDAMDLSLRDISFPLGESYTTDGIHGGALWAPPGKWKMGLLQQILLTPKMARVTTWKRLGPVMAGINVIERKHPRAPHFYLFVLGTEPEHQGKSVGTQLLAPILERCDREGMPAYLESSKERNLLLYERNGFRVTEKMNVPGGGPPIWLMWRDPK